MHREPEVLEATAQVGKWLDCPAGITSNELAPLHSLKNGILQNACSTSPKMDAGLGKTALMRIARLKNSPANGDGWFSGWSKVFVICKKNSNTEFDAKISSSLNKIIHNSQFKRRISLEEQKAQKEDRFLRGRQIAYLIYDHFRVTGSHDSVENYADLFTIVLRNDDIQEFDSKWDGILLSMTKIPPDDILEGLYKSRIRESEKLKTVLELYNMETHQKKAGPDYHRLNTMEKRSIEQNLRMKRPETEIMRQTPWSRTRGQNSVNKELQEIVGSGKPTGSAPKETIAVSGTMWISVQNRHSLILLRDLQRSRVREMHREPEVRQAKVRVEECLDGHASITSKEFAPINSFCEKWHPPECLLYKSEDWCRCGEKCSYAHRQVDEQPSKRSKKNGDKSAVAILLKSTRQLGCVFQDMEPPKSSSISRKSSNILKPVRCVRFTEAVLRHANIRDQNPSLGMICPGDPHHRNPNAPKIWGSVSGRDGMARAMCTWSSVERLVRSVLKIKEKNKTAFFSPSEKWCLLAPSTLKTRGKRLCCRHRSVDAHDQQKGLLNSSELETVTTSRSPTTVVTPNGEVQTHEEATVYVKELEIILTMKVLENTPAVLTLGKLCDEHGYSYEWINGQKNHISSKTLFGYNATQRTSFRSWFLVCQRLKLALFNIHDTFKAGNWSSHVILKLVYITNHDIFNCVKRQCD